VFARNKGLSNANGRYILLDADDLWKPEKLRKQIDFLKTNKIPFTFSFYDCIDEEENHWSGSTTKPFVQTIIFL
jgi:glycosyltransferase involved in cell wall biosynthesis